VVESRGVELMYVGEGEREPHRRGIDGEGRGDGVEVASKVLKDSRRKERRWKW